jgi:hypothetical protein
LLLLAADFFIVSSVAFLFSFSYLFRQTVSFVFSGISTICNTTLFACNHNDFFVLLPHTHLCTSFYCQELMLIDYSRFTNLLGCTAPICRRRLRSGVRTPLLTDCRRIISARLHEQGYSFTEIGEELRRHPTTVFRLVQTHQTLLEGDPVYPRTVERLLEKMKEEEN